MNRLIKMCGLLMLTQLSACFGPFYEGEAVIQATALPSPLDAGALRNRTTAVLPVVASAAQQGYMTVLSLALDKALAATSRPIRHVSAHRAISILNGNELVERYTQMIDNYRQAGLLERNALQAIGEAFDADYVLLPALAGLQQDSNDRLGNALTLFRTYSTQLQLSLQLWDTRTGELLWQSAGQLALAKERFTWKPVAVSDVAENLWQGMLEDLLAGRTSSRYSPLEDLVGLH